MRHFVQFGNRQLPKVKTMQKVLKHKRKVKRRRASEAMRDLRSSMMELVVLSELYDQGIFSTSRTLSAVMHRVLESELPIALPGFDSFASYIDPTSDAVISLHLCGMGLHVDGDKFVVTHTHQPVFENAPVDRHMVSRAVWLQQLVVNTSPPSENTFYLRRQNFIKRTRDESGAHYDSDLSEAHQILRWPPLVLGDIGAGMGDGENYTWSENPERFIVRNTPADAIIRSITSELLDTLEPKSEALWAAPDWVFPEEQT